MRGARAPDHSHCASAPLHARHSAASPVSPVPKILIIGVDAPSRKAQTCLTSGWCAGTSDLERNRRVLYIRWRGGRVVRTSPRWRLPRAMSSRLLDLPGGFEMVLEGGAFVVRTIALSASEPTLEARLGLRDLGPQVLISCLVREDGARTFRADPCVGSILLLRFRGSMHHHCLRVRDDSARVACGVSGPRVCGAIFLQEPRPALGSPSPHFDGVVIGIGDRVRGLSRIAHVAATIASSNHTWNCAIEPIGAP